MSNKILCLFDVDGTLTAARKVGLGLDSNLQAMKRFLVARVSIFFKTYKHLSGHPNLLKLKCLT